MKNAYDYINRYIERNARDLAEALYDGKDVRVFLFVNGEAWEVTTREEATEEGDWELLEEVDSDYIAEDDSVAEYLDDWEAYNKDPYGYNGVSVWDFA